VNDPSKVFKDIVNEDIKVTCWGMIREPLVDIKDRLEQLMLPENSDGCSLSLDQAHGVVLLHDQLVALVALLHHKVGMWGLQLGALTEANRYNRREIIETVSPSLPPELAQHVAMSDDNLFAIQQRVDPFYVAAKQKLEAGSNLKPQRRI
jgi:hypothetical protein